jgi:hypothetical protein
MPEWAEKMRGEWIDRGKPVAEEMLVALTDQMPEKKTAKEETS